MDHPNGMCTFTTVMSDDLEGISNRLADWANGKEDSDLDKWYKDMGGKAPVQNTSTTSSKDKAPSVDFERMRQDIDMQLNSQGEDFIQKLSEQAIPWWKSLSKEQRAAIKKYTGPDYVWMNKALREGKLNELSPERRAYIEKAMEGLKLYRTQQDMVVRRGSSLDSVFSMLGIDPKGKDGNWLSEHFDEIKGSIATDAGFFSTSPDKSGGFRKEVEFRVLVPQGSEAPYIGAYSSHKKEKEVLIPPGSIYRLVGVETGGLRSRVYLEFLGT